MSSSPSDHYCTQSDTESRGASRAATPYEIKQAISSSAIQKHLIQNDDLYELLTYGDGLLVKRIEAGNWSGGSEAARTALTYLAQRAFGIHRLPWYPDRYLCRNHEEEQRAVKFLTDAHRVEKACEALQEVHLHCVGALRAIGVSHVRLCRGVRDDDIRVTGKVTVLSRHGYASRVAKMAYCAKRLRRTHFDLPIDVLTSWSDGGYPYSVVMEHDVPIADVAWFSELLGSRSTAYPHAFESDEWVVLNRSEQGRVRLKTSSLVKVDFDMTAMSSWTPKLLEQELASAEMTYGLRSTMWSDHPTSQAPYPFLAKIRTAWRFLRV